jgi:hypothetical protein
MAKFKLYGKFYHSVVICLLIIGLISSLLMFSINMRKASSTVTDKGSLPHFNTLMAGSYFLN